MISLWMSATNVMDALLLDPLITLVHSIHTMYIGNELNVVGNVTDDILIWNELSKWHFIKSVASV